MTAGVSALVLNTGKRRVLVWVGPSAEVLLEAEWFVSCSSDGAHFLQC